MTTPMTTETTLSTKNSRRRALTDQDQREMRRRQKETARKAAAVEAWLRVEIERRARDQAPGRVVVEVFFGDGGYIQRVRTTEHDEMNDLSAEEMAQEDLK